MKLSVILVLAFVATVTSENNGLARLPPMGWNTWCTNGPCERDYCDEVEIRSIADAMVDSGMHDLGWTYINLDDCWADGRDAQGNIYPDPARFPSGMKATADYLHAKGLKFGLYTCAGIYTCSSGGRNHSIPGSYGHYQQDANTYASWGMDLVKMDWCNTKINGTQLDPRVQYPEMSQALNATGWPILFSACEWGVDNPWLWAANCTNTWRTGPDHHDNWDSTSSIIEINAELNRYAGPGGWNDPDFLMTGGQGCASNFNATCPGQTNDEYITEFSLWSIMGAPLFVATDIRNMSAWKQSVLLNKEAIAISQDPLAQPGGRVGYWECSQFHACQIWARPLAGGSYAIGLYNSGDENHNITADFDLLPGWTSKSQADIRNVWTHQDLGSFTGSFTASVPSHGTVLVRASPQ
eukprot:TRINITY_DN7289_c0_g1_i1.p1 TRINITY_DN7289_c0_g1~~TRINITY_DN7289_c0_g1_i1.p1  ORF type:complete len:410 (-),score=-64.28 TRINITY_DN7289_c0_g1_i1:80-1309(-)